MSCQGPWGKQTLQNPKWQTLTGKCLCKNSSPATLTGKCLCKGPSSSTPSVTMLHPTTNCIYNICIASTTKSPPEGHCKPPPGLPAVLTGSIPSTERQPSSRIPRTSYLQRHQHQYHPFFPAACDINSTTSNYHGEQQHHPLHRLLRQAPLYNLIVLYFS